jgi:hypothetical protein
MEKCHLTLYILDSSPAKSRTRMTLESLRLLRLKDMSYNDNMET